MAFRDFFKAATTAVAPGISPVLSGGRKFLDAARTQASSIKQTDEGQTAASTRPILDSSTVKPPSFTSFDISAPQEPSFTSRTTTTPAAPFRPPTTIAPAPITQPTARPAPTLPQPTAQPSLRPPTAAPSAPPTAPSGFVSPDAGVQAQIKQMQEQAIALSTQAPAAALPLPKTIAERPPNAPAQPTDPFQTERDQIGALRQAVLSSFNLSPEEKLAQDQLKAIIAQQANLAASEQMGLAEMANQPIVLGLIRGQQQALQRQAATQQGALQAQAVPLEVQLQNLQASRALQGQRAETELGFGEIDLQRQEAQLASRQAAQAEATKPIEIDGNLVQFNPETGQFDTVFRAPTDTKPITLSQGQILVDPVTGERIAAGAEKDPQLPAAVEEYNAARQTGFQGSFIDYLSAKSQAGESVPTSFKEWQLSGSPGSFGDFLEKQSVKAPSTAQAQAATFSARVDQAEPTIDELGPKFAGLLGKVPGVPGFLKSEDRRLFEQAERNFINAVLRRESGAAIAESEFISARQQYIPQRGDSEAVLDQKKATRDLISQGLSNEAGAAAFGAGTGDGAIGQSFDSVGLPSDDLSRSQKGSFMQSLGPITGFGSPLWKPGLDIDLKKGDPVQTPVDGTIVDVKTGHNRGFGSQVKIRDNFGNEIWLSHLDLPKATVGSQVRKGQVIGLGGNTGNVIPLAGGDGSHLDVTMKDPQGRLFTAHQVNDYLNSFS